MTRRDLFTDLLKAALGGLALPAQAADRTVYLSLAEARPVLENFAGELPGGLQGVSLNPDAWLAWVTARDAGIRARLKGGDADSVLNLVLFGTSFTSQPRVTGTQSEDATGRLILARVKDMAQAASHPGRNERLQFAAEWLQANGADPSDPASGKRVEAVLLENALRVLREQREYSKAIEEAKRNQDAAGVFVTRSSLYRSRGLSLDTSFRPNFAIERSLAEMKEAGLLRRVQRAAVIGPGLDFADKRSGYDFYPIQTLQPFALIDSLRRLGLAGPAGPEVEICDLSSRVLGHVRRARAQARAGAPYTVRIPLDGDTRWLPETIGYWRTFGSEIGTEAEPMSPPASVQARMHAIRIRPGVVALLRPADVDMVTQHLPLPADRRFDLVIATNILVYYSPFEQALAMRNIADMLRPGGVLLTNNALPEVSGVPMRPAGATSVAYSEDPDDGDRVVWYRRTAT
ncbi:MAG: class I SAM-dependent methyltransferase [Bryobacteraceae bacterium]|jgi:SAM-dependent methyltransferase